MSDMSFDKGTWRARNMAFIREHKSVPLKEGYAELSGETGDLMYSESLEGGRKERMKEGLIPKNRYYPIDQDIICAVAMRRKDLPYTLYVGDVFQVATRLAKSLGVLCLDTTNGIREKWWLSKFHHLRDIIQAMGSPNPILIFNHAFDRGGEPATDGLDRLRTYADCLFETFGSLGLQRKRLWDGVEEAAKKDFSWQTENRDYTQAGGFDIYRSRTNSPESEAPVNNSTHRIRMATVRLAFNLQTKRTDVFRGK